MDEGGKHRMATSCAVLINDKLERMIDVSDDGVFMVGIMKTHSGKMLQNAPQDIIAEASGTDERYLLIGQRHENGQSIEDFEPVYVHAGDEIRIKLSETR
jgi:hypothetical protein